MSCFLTILILQVCHIVSVFVVDKQVLPLMKVVKSNVIRRRPHRSPETRLFTHLLFWICSLLSSHFTYLTSYQRLRQYGLVGQWYLWLRLWPKKRKNKKPHVPFNTPAAMGRGVPTPKRISSPFWWCQHALVHIRYDTAGQKLQKFSAV